VIADAQRVKAGCDFVAVTSRYTRLKRSGRQYVGLCPFHKERHPSLYIHPVKKIFYCFGCGAGGDVFRFVMLAEGCEFRRALEIVIGLGVAEASEPRSGERFGRGVGAKPLLLAQQAVSHSPKQRTQRLPLAIELPPLTCAAEAAYEAERLIRDSRKTPLLELEG